LKSAFSGFHAVAVNTGLSSFV